MRQCEYKKHLSSYLDDQLNPLQENQVEEHLPLCNSCKEEWEELSKLKKLCSILPEEELPHGLHQRILTKVKMPRKSPRKYTWIQRVAVPLAAALFIFIAGKYGLNGFSGLFKSSESKPEGVLQEPVVMATHEADDNRALTAGEAPKDEGVLWIMWQMIKLDRKMQLRLTVVLNQRVWLMKKDQTILIVDYKHLKI
ncbi:MAG: hypothetical protein GX815_07780 [Clostridiales bacterium]|nr:hypothetical protein [Clostridiales bacterium]